MITACQLVLLRLWDRDKIMITASTRIDCLDRGFPVEPGLDRVPDRFLPANEVTQRDLNSIMLPTCFDFQYEGPSVTVGINRRETLCVRCDCVLVSDNSNFKLPFLCRCASSKQTKNVATDKEEKEIVESKKQGIGVGGTLGCDRCNRNSSWHMSGWWQKS